MITVKAKDVAKLIKRTQSYTAFLLHKEKVSMSDQEAVIDFIMRHRLSFVYSNGTERVGISSKKSVIKILDDYYFKETWDKLKEERGCEKCGTTEKLHLHHIDCNHFNNHPSNWQVLCRDCHFDTHREIKKEKGISPRKETVFNGETETEASVRLGGSRNLIYHRLKSGWGVERAFTEPRNQHKLKK